MVCCNLLLGYTLLKVDATGGNPVVNPSPVILGGAPAEYTGVAQKIVTNLPAGMRYAISTEYIDPAEIDAGKIVPTGYTALDYLQSTGVQYIDTGFATTTGMVARCAVQYYRRNDPGYNTFLGGYVINSGQRNYALMRERKSDTDKILWEMGSGTLCVNGYYGTATDAKYTMFFSTVSGNGFLDVDNHRVITLTGESSTPNVNVMLFSPVEPLVNIEGLAGASVNLYYGTIWDSEGKLVRDFVPVRGADGKLGMYDLVENKLYTNDGTGDDFIAGEKVNMNAGKLAYTENWADSVDDPANQMVLAANTKYYVYYYTPNADNTAVNAVSVKEFTVECNTHVFGEWQEAKAATCETDGERQRVCEGCGHTETEVIPALGHDWGEWEVVTKPTMEHEGEERRYCSHDNSHYETRPIPQLEPEPEVPDDGEVETPTTPETPKVETPENNTPWIMLFVGIGVGAVLLVGGITLGVVLSKGKNK